MELINLPLYCVSNWQSYLIVRANSPIEALHQTYQKSYRFIENSNVHHGTVVHAMCCEYKGYAETVLENLSSDIDRVLFLDAYTNTLRYQVIPRSPQTC